MATKDDAAGSAFDSRRYWDRRLAGTWSLQGVGLKGLSRSYNTWLYRVRDRVFGRMIAVTDVDPRGAEVLDIGPGVGFYTQRWLRLGARVTGVDIADSAVNRLRTRYPAARFEQLDISDVDPPLEGGFDVVDAFDVLFHIPDDERHARAIANVYRLLRPGGWFLFTDVFAHKRTKPSKHYVRRTKAEIEDAVLAAGFEIVRRRPAFVMMNYPFDASPRARKLWSKVLAPRLKSELGGRLVGAALFAPELLLTRVLHEGPTTEWMVCRKPVATS
jgi:SAM-dependent methyltransferase